MALAEDAEAEAAVTDAELAEAGAGVAAALAWQERRAAA